MRGRGSVTAELGVLRTQPWGTRGGGDRPGSDVGVGAEGRESPHPHSCWFCFGFFFFCKRIGRPPCLSGKGRAWGRHIRPEPVLTARSTAVQASEQGGRGIKARAAARRAALPAVCGDPLVTIKMKCPSAAIFSVWPICF